MKKKERLALEDRLRDCLREWVYRLRLSEMWAISPSFDWSKEPRPAISGGGKAGASAHCDPVYAIASIEFHMRAYIEADCNDEQTDFLIVHELMHVFLSEQRRAAEVDDDGGVTRSYADAEERACEHLARRFVWMWNEHAKLSP